MSSFTVLIDVTEFLTINFVINPLVFHPYL